MVLLSQLPLVMACAASVVAFHRMTPKPTVKPVYRYRVDRLSRAGSLLIASGVFLILLVPAPFVIEGIATSLFGSDYISAIGFSEDLNLAILIAVSFLIPFLASRLVYAIQRWRTIECDAPICRHCGYNLTGNESGVCPECATPVPKREPTT